jgi:MoaA/NifB/PqqE/SkfB family radical SAM enzyme
MTPLVFEQALARVIELDDVADPHLRAKEVSFCGLGDQLLNPEVARYVRATRDTGVVVSVNTNAALLDEARGGRLLDAGVTRVFVNAGEVGDAYEAVYGLPFERVQRNVSRFASMAEGRCELYVVLVDHGRDPRRVHEVERFWRDQGVTRFFRLDLLNRGGTLELEGMDFERAPEHAEAVERLEAAGSAYGCMAAFAFPFIGYDGQYYLCSSDWEKATSIGDVFSHSILEVVERKYELVRSRQPVCHRCNHDAVNRLTARLASHDTDASGEEGAEALTDRLVAEAASMAEVVATVAAHLESRRAGAAPQRPRRLIPVTVT